MIEENMPFNVTNMIWNEI